jgi:hypothetical protein
LLVVQNYCYVHQEDVFLEVRPVLGPVRAVRARELGHDTALVALMSVKVFLRRVGLTAEVAGVPS